ncbi:MAG: ATPase P, partial [Bacteroidetes bacterium]
MSEGGEDISLSIGGMTCTNCAQSIVQAIEKTGATKVDVNFITSEAHITLPAGKATDEILKAVRNAGYTASPLTNSPADQDDHGHSHTSGVEKRFYFSLIFTLPLFSHMFLPFIDILQNPILQLSLCVPVYIMGLHYFGKSAFYSLKSGIPNMDVLITMGFSAAFFYSLAGTIIFWGTPELHDYLFYETAATIITLVMLGNVIEHRSVDQTTTAISELSKIQPMTATRIIGVDKEERVEQIKYEHILKGDILLVNEGDKIPADGKIIWGESLIDESMVSGESLPVSKRIGDFTIGGTLVIEGIIRIEATSLGEESILAKIIDLVKRAQQNKPDIQRLGDTISNVFVPVVIAISIGTFFFSYFLFEIDLQKAIMSSIAVLVISCPCAMGLATPTAVMAGIGRAAKNGILIKGGAALEEFAKVKTIVFDKTGTLTTGKFQVSEIECLEGLDEKQLKDIVYSL